MVRLNIKTREIFIYHGIGSAEDGRISAADFAESLGQLGPGPLTLRLNSPGGSVHETFAMLTLLEERTAPVKVVVDGLAASAASLFLCNPAWTRVIGSAGEVMIHDPHSAAIGTADDFREMATILDEYSAKLAGLYARVMRLELSAIREAMKRETYYRGQDAVRVGLVDHVGGPVRNDLAAPKVAAATKRLERMRSQCSWLKAPPLVAAGVSPFPKREAAINRQRELTGRGKR
jgi:ATP-dependent Clp protease protease subunit